MKGKNLGMAILVCAMMVSTAVSILAIGEQPSDDNNEAQYPNGSQQISTTVNVAGGGGPSGNQAPIIKCKWEYDLNSGNHEGIVPSGYFVHDSDPNTEGLQVAPVLEGSVRVGFYAVVTDPQGVNTVSKVYADVWHPDGTYKYQIELQPVGFSGNGYNKCIALDLWNHVKTYHHDLITYNGYSDNEIDDELNEELAYIYYGEASISYCQPGGYYYVGVRAVDTYNTWSEYLYNKFWYIPTAAVRVDFNQIDYGTAAVSTPKWIGGDKDMNTPSKPTVKNIGNTPVNLHVWQNDMGFGKTGSEWNVQYDARLSADGTVVNYYPNDEATIPGILGLCTTEKLDFSIHVKKAMATTYNGVMHLYAYIDGSAPWNTPSNFVGTAPNGVPQTYQGPYP